MVEHGDTIEITDRGRPVAVLGPMPSGSPLEQLRRTGEIEPATADFNELPEPMPSTASRLPSEVLAGLRAAER
jgi:antitoxin (DNA-binding transcriptional repressor) of toxin-antitoxin stability system